MSGDFVKSNNNNLIVYRECKKIICFTKKERVKYVSALYFYFTLLTKREGHTVVVVC